MTETATTDQPEAAAAPRKTFTRSITRPLNAEEVSRVSAQHVAVLDEIDELKDQRKSAAAAAQETIDEKDAFARELRRQVKTGMVEEQIECYEDPDLDRFQVHIHRADTGERIDTRAMDVEERKAAMNPTLPLTDPPPDNVVSIRTAAGPDHTHPPLADGEAPPADCLACASSKADDADAAVLGADPIPDVE